MQHLLILSYKTDAGRKRIDYLIEKWGARPGISIQKPDGIAVLFDGGDLEEFVEDACSRMESGSNPPAVYILEKSSATVQKQVRHLEFSTSRSAETITNFVSYLLAKQNAVFEYTSGSQNVYSARTKKGLAEIRVMIETNAPVRCLISVEGYGDVAGFLAERIESEMNVFLGGT